jgi:hypothetical protein
MERYLQALDELDDLWIGLRQLSMPWLAVLLAALLDARFFVGACARDVRNACSRLTFVRAPQLDVLDFGLRASGRITLSVRNVTE